MSFALNAVVKMWDDLTPFKDADEPFSELVIPYLNMQQEPCHGCS
jgi:hypothetical protein